MARALRVQFDGALYHLVVRANNRQPLFLGTQDRRHYLDLLGRYRGQFGFRIYCYLLINRQVHLLIETPKGNVSKVMQCLGTSYTSYFNRRHKRRGTLFEGRYKSYLIENGRYLPEVTRHIHQSAFPSGLNTNKNRHYPWSSYRIYLGIKPSDLVDTEPVLVRFGDTLKEQQKRYREFVESEDLRESGRRDTRHLENYPSFVEKVDVERQSAQMNRREDDSLKVAERILREVSLSLSLTPNEMGDLPESRRRGLARHVAMYLIRKQTSLPLRSIGQLLGVKAPAVALGIGKVEQLLKRENFSKKVKSLLENNTFSSSASEMAGEYSPLEREFFDGNSAA